MKGKFPDDGIHILSPSKKTCLVSKQGVPMGEKAARLFDEYFSGDISIEECKIVLLRSDGLPEDLALWQIRKIAGEKGFKTPPPELALFLRVTLSEENMFDMGLDSILVMHHPLILGGNKREWFNFELTSNLLEVDLPANQRNPNFIAKNGDPILVERSGEASLRAYAFIQ
jgi:hypothetical protein